VSDSSHSDYPLLLQVAEGDEKALAALVRLHWRGVYASRTQVSDLKFWNNAAARLYSIKAIPQNFLIDPSGKIIGKNLRGSALEKKLEEVL
jgi:hypothetical protein